MTVLAVLAVIALVAYEVRADRKVRRSTAGATPVVIVRGMKPRWWRGLLGKGLSLLAQLGFLVVLVLAGLHMAKAKSDVTHSWPMPTATPTSSPSPLSPASPTRKGH